MSVGLFTVRYYVCTCDECGAQGRVEKDYDKVYNPAQAVRELGWSYGKDKRVKCKACRMHEPWDCHKWRRR